MRIIGLGGYAFTGKDAVADVLEQGGWERAAFSDPVNEALRRLNPKIPVWLLGMPPYEIEYAFDQYLPGDWDWVEYSWLVDRVGYSESKRNPEVRRLLQTLATEVVREMFGQDSWSELMRARLRASTAPGFVVTGVRFANEHKMLREEGAELWWVLRPGYGPVNRHASEHSLKYTDFDRVILNDGTLEELAAQVRDSAREVTIPISRLRRMHLTHETPEVHPAHLDAFPGNTDGDKLRNAIAARETGQTS